MKMMRKSTIALALALLSIPVISAQDLSKYRNFSLGTSLADLSKQVNKTPADASVINQSQPLIQNLVWWPLPSSESLARPEPVQEIRFSFFDGALYRIVATYGNNASTQGLTAEDMVGAISAQYGIATRPPAEADPPVQTAYSSAGKTIASWEDSHYSVSLSHSSLSGMFQLDMCAKQLNAQAEAAIAATSEQLREGAPQREVARVKKEADDLETARQANLKAFRP
jgi:hypothetical protein